MAIDFTLSPEVEAIRERVRDFIQNVVRPAEEKIGDPDKIERSDYIKLSCRCAPTPRPPASGPHMPKEWGGMGLGHVELAMVQAEAAKAYYGRGCSTARPPTRATCTPSSTGRPTRRRRNICARSATAT